MSKIRIKALKIRQPIGTFYVGVMDGKKLGKLCSKKIDLVTEDNGYIFQRKYNPLRVKSLKMYVEYSKATFPNGVILNSNNKLNYIAEDSSLEFDDEKDAFFIIDGQHRLNSLEHYNGSAPFELCVIIFDNIGLDDQTEIFATVNSEQKQVDPSVRYNMLGNDVVDTPEKIVREIAYFLNTTSGSPFENRIKFTDEESAKNKLSLAAFMKPVVANIYNVDFRYKVKDALSLSNNDRTVLTKQDYEKAFGKIFSKYYIQGKEGAIYKMLLNYFKAIRDNFENDWNNEKSLLSKTTGYNAFMMLFVEIFHNEDRDMSYDYLNTMMKLIKNNFTNPITLARYGLGNAASMRLCKDIFNVIKATNMYKFNNKQLNESYIEDSDIFDAYLEVDDI